MSNIQVCVHREWRTVRQAIHRMHAPPDSEAPRGLLTPPPSTIAPPPPQYFRTLRHVRLQGGMVCATCDELGLSEMGWQACVRCRFSRWVRRAPAREPAEKAADGVRSPPHFAPSSPHRLQQQTQHDSEPLRPYWVFANSGLRPLYHASTTGVATKIDE